MTCRRVEKWLPKVLKSSPIGIKSPNLVTRLVNSFITNMLMNICTEKGGDESTFSFTWYDIKWLANFSWSLVLIISLVVFAGAHDMSVGLGVVGGIVAFLCVEKMVRRYLKHVFLLIICTFTDNISGKIFSIFLDRQFSFWNYFFQNPSPTCHCHQYKQV